MNILVIDDERSIRNTLKEILEYEGHAVKLAESGTEALELIKGIACDLIFCDIKMPGMDGIETASMMRNWERQENKKLTIIALTANAITGMKELFLEQGFDDYVSKPIEISRLNEVMTKWISADKKKLRRATDGVAQKTDAQPIIQSIEGLNFEAGMERYGETSYNEILRTYFVHTPPILEKLRKSANPVPSKEQIGDYTITVHGLKGSSYGICAESIGKQAEALENAARSEDMKFIAANNWHLIGAAETLIKNISDYLSKISETQEEKKKAAAPDQSLLTEYLDACKNFKIASMENVQKKLEEYDYESESGAELVKWLREQLDNLEYDAIIKKLENAK
jgi:CheY-like chemotaxis protein